MKHEAVKSSMAVSLAHKGDVLHVKFKSGKVYEYKGVSSAQFHALKNAESIGKHLNSIGIKGTLVAKN